MEKANRKNGKGLTLVYTGEGKGKTTAALGLGLRSTGRGMKVRIFQFIKSPQRTYGEQLAFKKLGVEMTQLGVGFTWTKTPEEHREALKEGWPKAKQAVLSGEYDVVQGC
ncbi:cob(I)alamin adenosyltransferase [Kroppenstedtia sanguinis]